LGVTINPYPSVNPIAGTSALCPLATSALGDATPGGTWSSSNGAVATIDIAGVVTAVAAGIDTLTPKEVSSAVAKSFGNAAVNENKGTLAPLARNANSVMTPLPLYDPANAGSPMARVIGTGLGGLIGGTVAHATGSPAWPEILLGGIAGSGHGGVTDVVNLLKSGAGRVVSTPGMQDYLKNQRWLPGRGTEGLDAATVARLLASPEGFPRAGK
jgi:hypothetical protein